ncbi:MAG: YggS family pyridoxal phosphate-dependent enzyme [Natronospirillum sp.]
MTTITNRWQRVLNQVTDSAGRCGRAPSDVTLMAVSKTFPLSAVSEAYAAGARHFGENYVQEGVAKVQQCPHSDIVWHFIGPVQSNKTRPIAEHFNWVHTIDRLKVARRLSAQRPAGAPPLNLCLQINISADSNKAGVAPADAAPLAAEIASLPHVVVRGLMTIPAQDLPPEILTEQFQAMRRLLDDLATHWPSMDTLSMGMSDDMMPAIAAGSTCVRVGRGIFGHRPAKPNHALNNQ